MQKRIEWIDGLKGIGILLVVFGHSTPDKVAQTFLYSFHIPLFFFISGYLFNEQSYPKYGLFFRKSFKRLVLPFFIFYLLSHANTLVVSAVFAPGRLSHAHFYKPLLGLLYANSEWVQLVNNVPLWFLPCLFVAGNIIFFLNRCCRLRLGQLSLALLVLSFAAHVESRYIQIRLPWMMDTALAAAVFYGSGFVVKKVMQENGSRLPFRNASVMAVLSFALLAVNIYCAFKNGRVDMNGRHYGNYFLFYAGAFAGIFTFVMLARIVRPFAVLSYIGKKSITLLALHLPVSQIFILLVPAIILSFTNVQPWQIMNGNAMGFIIAAMTVSVLLIVLYLFDMRHGRKAGDNEQQPAENEGMSQDALKPRF